MNRERHEENLYPGFNPQHTYRAKPSYVEPDVFQESPSSSPDREPQQTKQQSVPLPILKSPSILRKKKQHQEPQTIVRPVLITVNDGDLGGNRSPNQPQQKKAEFKSTFLVGPGGTTRDPMKRTVTPEKEERKTKTCAMAPRRLQGSGPFAEDSNRNCLKRTSPQKEKSAKEMEEMEELQRIARKNRWKRGMERSWKDDADLASASAYGEESTNASSYLTYEESSLGDEDSYTDGSVESSQWTGYTSITGRSTKDHRGQRRSKSLSRRRRSGSVFDSVAEDLGVVASMLLSDGTSCISGAMDITRETIVSCKQN